MERFMEIFEHCMIAVAFAEEGVSVAFLRQRADLQEELGGQAWELI